MEPREDDLTAWRLEQLEKQVAANRAAETLEHEAINARIAAVADKLEGRLWAVAGAVVGSVIVAAVLQGVFQ